MNDLKSHPITDINSITEDVQRATQLLPQTVLDIDNAINILDQRQDELNGGVDSVANAPRCTKVVNEESNALGKLLVSLRDTRATLLAA